MSDIFNTSFNDLVAQAGAGTPTNETTTENKTEEYRVDDDIFAPAQDTIEEPEKEPVSTPAQDTIEEPAQEPVSTPETNEEPKKEEPTESVQEEKKEGETVKEEPKEEEKSKPKRKRKAKRTTKKKTNTSEEVSVTISAPQKVLDLIGDEKIADITKKYEDLVSKELQDTAQEILNELF